MRLSIIRIALFQMLSELLEVNDCLTGDIAKNVLENEIVDKKIEKEDEFGELIISTYLRFCLEDVSSKIAGIKV